MGILNKSRISGYIFMVFLSLITIVSCNGSSDSDDIFIESIDNAQNADSYSFSLSFPTDNPFTVDMRAVSETFAAAIQSPWKFTGSYVYSNKTVTLNRSSSNTLTITTMNDPANLSMAVMVNEPVTVAGTGNPSHGVLVVYGDKTITMTFSDTGVTIKPDQGTEENYSWEGLSNLLKSRDASVWQKQAALACSLVKTVTAEVNLLFSSISIISLNRDTLTPDTPVKIDGDKFPGSPPAGMLPQGRFNLSMTDRNGNTRPDAGDDFMGTYVQYWIKESAVLTLGSVSMNTFIRTVETRDGAETVTKTGFQAPDGSILYKGLTRYKTIESSPGLFTLDESSTMTLNGKLSLLFEK